jgi:PleD family two-component response regulator
LPDSPALLDTFVEVHASAQGAPIVVLADTDDENLSNRLLRSGAQDVLVKSEIECVALARSLRYAIERQRRNEILRTSPFTDDLTGSLTEPGFLSICRHYQQLSSHCRTNLLLASFEMTGPVAEKSMEGREIRELLLIRAAEALRSAFQSPVLIGRFDGCRFGVITAGLTRTTVEALLSRAASQVEDAANSAGRHVTAVVFSLADLETEDNAEELLAAGRARSTGMVSSRMKTAILAD